MWSIKKLYGKQVFSFETISFDVKQGVATSVTGKNLDNDTQGSNGSGKSSLLEIASISLAGTPLRKIKMEELINDAYEDGMTGVILYNPSVKEELTIERFFSRKEAQIIKLKIVVDGQDITETVGKLSGVDEYNKFILDRIGVSKDDLLNNFILSKYKHSNFILASDNEKKEIINRFSNGHIIDKAIESLQEDIKPLEKEVGEIEKEASKIDGKQEAVKAQIIEFNASSEEKDKTRKENIENYKKSIQEKRAEIREYRETLSSLPDSLKASEKDLSALEDYLSACSFEDIEGAVNNLCEAEKVYRRDNPEEIKDYLEIYHGQLEKFNLEISSLQENEKSLKDIEGQHAKTSASLIDLNESFKTLKDQKKKIDESLVKTNLIIRKNILDVEEKIKILRADVLDLSKEKAKLNNILAGKIVCPKCSHEFNLDYEGEVKDIPEKVSCIDDEITKNKESSESLEKKINTLSEEVRRNEKSISSNPVEVDEILKKIETEQNSLLKLNKDIATLTAKITSSKLKVDEFNMAIFKWVKNEINGKIDCVSDEIREIKADEKNINAEIEQADLYISNLQAQIKEMEEYDPSSTLKDLKKTLKEYEKEYIAVIAKKEKSQTKLNELIQQSETFLQYKTYLANTKVEALSEITNSFLEVIGSDLRIEFIGFTKLKNGKVRDKISTNLIRNGVEVGSFGKLSMGEQARILVACILAINKLTNLNCEDTKGLDFLAMDEVLEGTDEDGLMAVIHALNDLGMTSMIVSQLKVADNYDHVITAVKENGVSTIQ